VGMMPVGSPPIGKVAVGSPPVGNPSVGSPSVGIPPTLPKVEVASGTGSEKVGRPEGRPVIPGSVTDGVRIREVESPSMLVTPLGRTMVGRVPTGTDALAVTEIPPPPPPAVMTMPSPAVEGAPPSPGSPPLLL